MRLPETPLSKRLERRGPALALVLAAVAAGCGGGDDAETPGTGASGAADVLPAETAEEGFADVPAADAEAQILANHAAIERAIDGGAVASICDLTDSFRHDDCLTSPDELEADYEGTDDITSIEVEGDSAAIHYADTDETESWQFDDGQWKWRE